MAGQNRRLRRRNQTAVVEPLYSFNTLVSTTLGFVILIGGFVYLTLHSDSEIGKTSSSSRKTNVFSQQQDIPSSVINNLDAILVLGGGVPESIDHPPVYVERRCDDAFSIVKRRRSGSFQTGKDENRRSLKSSKKSTDIPILCLSAGTAHLPQLLGADGLPVWESTSCAAYLSNKYGLSENVFVETTSYDTIGNAFYSRTSHTDVNGWRNLLIITNEFHMKRTISIFDWIYLQCDPKKPPYNLYYLSSSNVGLTEEAVQARKEREVQSEKTVREKLAPKYKTLKDVWYFLNTDHSLYTSSKLVNRAKGIGNSATSDMVKLSYGKNGK